MVNKFFVRCTCTCTCLSTMLYISDRMLRDEEDKLQSGILRRQPGTIEFIFMASACTNGFATEQLEAQPHLYKLTFGYITSMSLKCAVELGIPDKMNSHSRPITLPELVSALNLHPKRSPPLQQLMRFLVSHGLFAKTITIDKEEAYTLTPSSKLLLKENTEFFSGFVSMHLNPAHLNGWQSMGDWFRRDEAATPFESATGIGFFEFLRSNPDEAVQFNEAMDSDSKLFSSLILQELLPAFEGLDSLVDVAGGVGALATNISKAFPQLKCTVLDLPNVVANLTGSDNLTYVGGDMFKYIPPADAVVLKYVFHNWSDEDCVTILKNCKEAISKGGKRGKVVIIDMVLNDEADHDRDESNKLKLSLDMTMMVFVNGRERTEKEWKSLFVKAGFSNYKIKPLHDLRSLIEVFP